MPTGANPFIKAGEIEAMRGDMGERIASQEIDAEFLEVGGRFFDEWDEAEHTELLPYSPGEQPGSWEYFGGLDWGYGSPFAFVLCSIDRAGTTRVIGEVHEERLITTEQAGKVLALLNAWRIDRKRVPTFADPRMFHDAKRANLIGEADIEAFWRAGLNCVKANDNRIQGWNTLREWLHRPSGFKIARGHCPKLISLFPQMVHDEVRMEDMDTSGDDHLHDCLRYALHTRRMAAKAGMEPVPESAPGWYKRACGRRELIRL
jgi:hypothetical protein